MAIVEATWFDVFNKGVFWGKSWCRKSTAGSQAIKFDRGQNIEQRTNSVLYCFKIGNSTLFFGTGQFCKITEVGAVQPELSNTSFGMSSKTAKEKAQQQTLLSAFSSVMHAQ